MIGQLRVGVTGDGVGIDARIDDEHGLDPFFTACRDADGSRIADAGNSIEHALDVLGEDVQPFGRHDHFLLAAPDEQLAVPVDFADVARAEPAVFEGTRRFAGGVEVASRHVLAAHENFAVLRDFHLDARDGFPDRALLGTEWMIEGHNRRRLREAVTLNHDESQLGPEGFQLAFERRRADDERPEFESEEPVDAAEMPPSQNPMAPGARRRGVGCGAARMVTEHVQNFGH